MNPQDTFMSFMDSGGPIMWVIFVVACGAMILLAWEAIRLSSLIKYARLDYEHLRASDKQLLTGPNNQSPITKLFKAVNWSTTKNKDDFSQEINIHFEGMSTSIAGSLSTIAILGSLLPMLGLLGTVTGMINVFEVIALQGSGKPEHMADGISQALLTTASGLIIAIPVIFTHHLLTGRVNELMTITRQAIHFAMNQDIDSLKSRSL